MKQMHSQDMHAMDPLPRSPEWMRGGVQLLTPNYGQRTLKIAPQTMALPSTFRPQID